ncbi:2-octaprenyl-3-methyl-6-methoxy-1,4-benzoquinol hydroxylase [Bathymodiolus platifrons methanotrophic gill symbiont]|uniref:FAD-dependent monooxygenase n=1 Tax=Bathymodiolus platifrons methanotrophic gill symbiont TaxID=113268 RepID=UPI000B411A7F|nr:FAD-dependent monooxygenase [Bathymodiolus platifrons methanotrophic gill symbiont]MCK5870908.1 FAD-dependent monooxygenase [Methyloprofundus sp.]TXK95234.1 2-octaprenyl-3-methyl-6-methoxy-1,4-benzoquinol hydroxylase [Methylococcaceae bacterium CS4]TXK97348.1 2-octaprenyl-3-methyl-6-methoxy-1,4-benzoquinol hydroxylase [Methylococcaceae bacterium CS5]TXL01779.1 2-octaprenyl-3-methyl-6-methoxy-1,4-benzoquinol hydroxylase [Methylococcaceae bacterium HT1]TXL04183.1 2-octaprenyl-3-methyl-6-metho
MKEEYDVLIVGGGMVGAAVACALGDSDLKVALIEKSMPEEFSSEQMHDLRVSALSIASQQILQTVGAWDAVLAMRVCPFKRMRVWETAGDTEFNSDTIDFDALGYIVENRVTQLALLHRAQEFSNIEFLCPSTIRQINYVNSKGSVELDDGRVLSAKVVVGADGGQSRLRQTVGLGVTSWDYQQHAMVIYVETDYEQQDITWQRFVPTGPQAFLPLTGNYGSIVWYNTPDEVRRLKALAETELLAELTETFPDCLGKINKILGVASFPLKRQHAQEYVKQGVALVGDAAHMINPLAGQGVNIGLLDAAMLAEVLIDASNKGKNIADVAVLKRYERLRRNENLKMMTVMDLFYRTFSNQILPIKFFRNLGLGLAERITPLKNKVMRGAMGLEGRLPKLAKGESIIS